MPIVMKFGGTSVADAAAFENVARIVSAERATSNIVVVSAMSGVTDALLAATPESVGPIFSRHLTTAEQLLQGSELEGFADCVNRAETQVRDLLHSQNPSKHKSVQDAVVAFGEILSSTLMAAVLNQRGVEALQVDARRCIITDEEHTSAAPLMKETFARTEKELRPLVQNGVVPVLGGFIAATLKGVTTTLGRGGSDYTAALIGAVLNVDEIQIWTDVTGVLTADPRVVPNAQTIDRLSYSEAAELAYFGAKVLHPKTIQPAIENSIPVRICNSRLPHERGTLVGPETETSPRAIKAIAHKTGVTVVQSLPRVCSALTVFCARCLRCLSDTGRWLMWLRHRKSVCRYRWTRRMRCRRSLRSYNNSAQSALKREEPSSALSVKVCAGRRVLPGVFSARLTTSPCR